MRWISDFTIATPAFPDNQRTVFKGHLFVGDVLLSESGMRDHPLTPMTDANLVRVLQAQSRRPVGLIDYRTVRAGAPPSATRIDALRQDGIGLGIVDAVSNDDLLGIGEAVRDLPLVTGGSGVAIGLAREFRLAAVAEAAQRLPAVGAARGPSSPGSCSCRPRCGRCAITSTRAAPTGGKAGHRPGAGGPMAGSTRRKQRRWRGLNHGWRGARAGLFVGRARRGAARPGIPRRRSRRRPGGSYLGACRPRPGAGGRGPSNRGRR